MNYLINKWFFGPFSSWDSLLLLFSNYSRKISALSWLKWRYYQLTNNFCLGVNSNGAQNGNTVCNSNFLSLSSTYYSSLWCISELYSYPCICSNLDIGNILSSFLSSIPVGVIKCSISFTACFPFRPAFSRVLPSAQSRSSSFSYVLPQGFTFMFLLPVLLLFKSSLLHAPRDKPPCKCDMAGVPFPQWTNTTADVLPVSFRFHVLTVIGAGRWTLNHLHFLLWVLGRVSKLHVCSSGNFFSIMPFSAG